MSQERWDAVDDFVTGQLIPADPVLEAALATSQAAGLPEISVSPAQGRMLELLARSHGARRILEIGTLGGYSAICLGRALPADGYLLTLEADSRHAEVAAANLARAGLGEIAEVRLGRGQDTLPKLAAEGGEPFDLIFIDADKGGYPDYFRWSMRLSRPGTVIIADNMVQDGAVADPDADGAAKGVREYVAAMAAEPRVSATVIQTVGSKGYDGFALAIVGAQA
jgi:predicted O-methyltransferase YrrM